MTNLTKAQAIANALVNAEITISETAQAIFVQLAKFNFPTAQQIRDAMPDVSGPSVNSNIGNLVKKGLIAKHDTSFIITDLGTEILTKAAEEYAQANPKQPKQKADGTTRGVRKPREVTPEMVQFKDQMEDMLKEYFDIKETIINRSNFEIKLLKRSAQGFRHVEIRNNGKIRVFAYKVTQDTINEFITAGFEVKESKLNVYMDIELCSESIETLKNLIK